MIPPFSSHGELPPGVHQATFAELEQRLGHNQHRRRLLTRLQQVLRLLADAGIAQVYVGGSFVTAKDRPGDLDACWVAERGYDRCRLTPEFFEEDGSLAGAAEIPGLDLFPDDVDEALARGWLARGEGRREKGVVLLRLGGNDETAQTHGRSG